MRISIRIKLCVYMIIIILLFAALLFGANSFFAEKFYISNKKDTLIECGNQLIELVINKSQAKDYEEELLYEISTLEKQIGGTIAIGNTNGEIFYPMESNHNSRGLQGLLQPDMFDARKQNFEKWEPYNSNSYFFITKAPDFEIDTLSFLIQQDTGVRILIWVPMAGISENASLSNKFTIIVSIITIIITAFITIIISDRFTKPIKEMNKITKQMSSLDFSRTLEINSKDELGELSQSINYLSVSLDEAIDELNEKNIRLQNDIIREKENDKMRSELFSNVSHELKTPIFLIQGYAEGLKANVAADTQRKEFYCDVIMEEADKMNILVKDILDLSRIESGMFQIQQTDFDLGNLITTVLAKYHQLFSEKEIHLQTNIEENCIIHADSIRVEQVIVNYINNAMNYVDSNKLITITLKESGPQKVKFSIYNSCKPIDEDDLDKIWTSFYKADKARKRDYGGSGLGLSIVRAIQEAHGNKYGVTNLSDGVLFWCEMTKARYL